MSSGGATLLGSFSGETGTITETGFYYGTTSGNLGNKVTAVGTSSPFSKALTGLNAGTKYYYKAYVIVSGEEVCGSEQSFTTKKVATASVTTSAATNINPTTVTLNGSYSGASGAVSDYGFYYKKSTDSDWQVVHLNSGYSSGTITANLSNLSESTTYQFKAWVEEFDESQNKAVDRFGSTLTFKTPISSATAITTYLDDYGIPDISSILSGTGTSGTNASTGDHWFSYNTTNNKRQIAIHTYENSTYGETVNYVVYYDENRYAPLWTAHTMNTTYWPDNGVTRSGDGWFKDPAISLKQIEGLSDNSNYSRGHFTASNYRKSTESQNLQTFYYTNKAAQWHDGFNNGVWSSLENRVKNIAPSGTTMLYVVTGVLYEGTLTYMSSNTKSDGNTYNVPIPSHFYKCIMKCTFNSNGTVSDAKGIAFVYTNESHTGDSYYKNGYYTSIDAIEERAGFNFFAKVPDDKENAAESNTDHRWFTGASNINSVTDNNWGSF